MFGKNRFGDNGAQTAGPRYPQHSREQVDYEDEQMMREQS